MIKAFKMLFLTLSWLAAKDCWAQELHFVEKQGIISLYQGSREVFGYQMETKSLNGAFPRANYLHPLNDLRGQALTEDFPEDHLHHRGIFWSWHQLKVNGISVADPWECKNITWLVKESSHRVSASGAQLTALVSWLVGDDPEPIMNEEVLLSYQNHQSYYTLDFDIRLESGRDGLELGGSNDEKGYGGFSTRFKLGNRVKFEDKAGKVQPKNTQVQAGPWMLISDLGEHQTYAAIMYHPKSTAALQGWILRDQGSMQNAVWPGSRPMLMDKGNQCQLRIRLVVFGDKPATDLVQAIYNSYSKE